jgi:hypothetical protein
MNQYVYTVAGALVGAIVAYMFIALIMIVFIAIWSPSKWNDNKGLELSSKSDIIKNLFWVGSVYGKDKGKDYEQEPKKLLSKDTGYMIPTLFGVFGLAIGGFAGNSTWTGKHPFGR